MARRARVISPTDYYHVIMRGNNRESIFSKKGQKQLFIDLLYEQVEDSLIDIAGYCVMDNHVHIAVKADLNDLTQAFKSINIKYAMKYNKEKDQIGHVFQDRFKSEIISNNINLIQVIRYIHNNPVKAKMVNSPDKYEWSSYNEYTGKVKTALISKEQKELVLELSSGIDSFIDFHKLEDNNEYLEITEDRDKNRINRAQEIIAEYLTVNGIQDVNGLASDSKLLEEVITEILDSTKLSHRNIASMLSVKSSKVHAISLKRQI